MRLRKAQIQNYRAIVDSGMVELNDRVTVLVGKNEQGKTTFLRALSSSAPNQSYAPSDLPNHRRAELEQRNAAEIPIVSLWLEPEESDFSNFEMLKPQEGSSYFKVTKYYDNHRTFHAISSDGSEIAIQFPAPSYTKQAAHFSSAAAELKKRFETHAARHADFKPHLEQAANHLDQFSGAEFDTIDHINNLVKTLSTALTSLAGQDTDIQNDIARAIKQFEGIRVEAIAASQQDLLAEFDKLLPSFAFHSTSVDMIPNEVNIKEFINDPDGTSRGMANLCRVASLSVQKIKELAGASDTPTRESYEDFYKGKVSGGINEFWTQETYHVHFRFSEEKLSVSISDDTYSPRIAPRDRSDGFQWYLSFYAALINEVSEARPVIFLLDNPALELHPDGQRDIKRFLEEKLPPSSQVIYVTHSPAMIDPFKLEQVRRVELRGNMEGTKICPLAFKDGSNLDLLEPVRSALGASLASSLIFNEFNLLVEGAADKPILEGALSACDPELAKKTVVNGSVAETPDGFLVRFYQRAKLPYLVYLDADSGGRDLKRRLQSWGIPDENILELSSIHTRDGDFELEDIVSEGTYHRAIVAAYPERNIPQRQEKDGKRTKHYEKQFRNDFGIGFNKRRVAEYLKTNLIEKKEVSEDSLNSLGEVVRAISSGMRGQVPAPQPAQTATTTEDSAEPFQEHGAPSAEEVIALGPPDLGGAGEGE